MSENAQFRVRNRVQIDGKTVGSYDVILQDANGYYLLVRGTSVPSSAANFAKGCLFIKTDAGAGVKSIYENVGTTSSCSFNLMGEVTGAEIGDDAVGADQLDQMLLGYKDVTLTAAEIKAVRATPITLVAATEAGAGYALVPTAVTVSLNAGSEALTESAANLAVRYSGQTTDLIAVESTGFIDQATDQNRYQERAEAVMTPLANTALVVQNNGAGEIAGNASDDATITFRTYYRKVPVL